MAGAIFSFNLQFPASQSRLSLVLTTNLLLKCSTTKANHGLLAAITPKDPQTTTPYLAQNVAKSKTHPLSI